MTRRLHSIGWVLAWAVVASSSPVFGAGFALYEGSARGNALGGTLTARADDPSAVFYNPAGITQLEDTQVMLGGTVITPLTDLKAGGKTTQTEDNTYIPPHAYATYQFSDRVWAGLGVYSRFGLGTEFDKNWPGRFNNYNAVIETVTVNPNIALKLHDTLSVALGASVMDFSMKLERKVLNPTTGGEMDLTLDGGSAGFGFNAGLRYAPLEWLALGAAYQSKVDQDVEGTADLKVKASNASGDVTLPDMVFMGVAVTLTEKLDVEAGAVFTGWSSYDEFSIDFDDPTLLGTPKSTSEKDWEDTWRYQVGLEYALTECLDLRLGFVFDQSPVPDKHIDYLVPANDRQLYSAGLGYNWKTWTVDVSYTYLMIEDRHIDARPAEGVLDSDIECGKAHMVGLSLSKKI